MDPEGDRKMMFRRRSTRCSAEPDNFPEAAPRARTASRTRSASSRLRAASALLIAASLTLAACGGGGDAGSASSGNTGEVNHDATLRLAYEFLPEHFDPQKAPGAAHLTPLYPVFDRLLLLDAAGNFQPMLATDWEFGESEVVLHLREGVTFHDGAAFNAQAVIANFEHQKQEPIGIGATTLASVSSMEAVDEYTVRLGLSQPDVGLPYNLAEFTGMMISPASFDDPGRDLNPVGAGPYRLAEYRSGERITYERFDDYWDVDSIDVKEIVMQLIPEDTARVNALLTGDVDAAWPISPTHIPQLEAGGMTVAAEPTLAVTRMWLRPAVDRSDPFSNPLVREALNYAIDREAIAGSPLYNGLADPAVGPFPEGVPYFAGVGGYGYDPHRARELLAQAGYANGFSFTLAAAQSNAALATIVQAQLAEVGINVEVRTGEGTEMTNSFTNGASQALIGAYGGRANPILTLQQNFSESGTLLNPTAYTTEKFEAQLAKAAQTVDDGARNELVKELAGTIYDEGLMAVEIVHGYATIAYREGVEGLEIPIWSDRAVHLRNVSVSD